MQPMSMVGGPNTISVGRIRESLGLKIYELRIGKGAEKAIKVCDRQTRRRFSIRFKKLAQDPYDPRISGPVKEGEGLRKSRVGKWRIFYEVDQVASMVSILHINSRGEAERMYQRVF